MAGIDITLTCPECGEEFRIKENGIRPRDVESTKNYYLNSNRLCRSCYIQGLKDRDEREFAAFCAEFPLPEIEAVSEKQRAYAEDLRKKYIKKFTYACRNMLEQCEKIKNSYSADAQYKAKMDEAMKEEGVNTLTALMEKKLEKHATWIFITSTSARAIIDTSKRKGVWG